MITARFNDALLFASQLHATQTRKGTSVPYISHLMMVAGLALEFGADETQAIGALLHDSIEDQAESFGGAAKLRAEIQGRYGDEVLSIVNACTDSEVEPKPEWRARKRNYIAHVAVMDRRAALVSVADKIANARSIISDQQAIGNVMFERFTAGQTGTLWYYGELAAAFEKHHPNRGSQELLSCHERMVKLSST